MENAIKNKLVHSDKSMVIVDNLVSNVAD
jgi:hypothetical protein